MFEYTKLLETIRVDNLITLHYFDYAKDFCFQGEAHDFWEMVYVDLGAVRVSANGDSFVVQQGESVFHKPNEFHNIQVEDRFASVMVITFDSKSPAMKFFENRVIRLDGAQKSCMETILEEGRSAFQEPLDIVDQERLMLHPEMPLGALQMIKIHLEKMLLDLMRKNDTEETTRPAPPTERGRKSGGEDTAEQVMVLLTEHLCQHLTLDEIALQVGFSKSYVKTLFRRSKGMSVMQMYNKMKIDYAKKLISEQKYFITEISEMVGFNSVHYFSRTFKKITGMTPSDYSQSVRKKALL